MKILIVIFLFTCSTSVHCQRYSDSIYSRIHSAPSHYLKIKRNSHGQNTASFPNKQDEAISWSTSYVPHQHWNDQTGQASNSYNVEYNIQFNNKINKKFRPWYTISSRPPNKDNEGQTSEIITGKIKKNERVRAPTKTAYPHLPKNNLFNNNKIPSGNSANSQSIYGGESKGKSQPHQIAYDTSNPWHNLSPNVEIGKSVEMYQNELYKAKPFGLFHTSNGKKTNSNNYYNNFNHMKALKHSQSFDFTNVHGRSNDTSTKEDNISAGSSNNYNSNAKESLISAYIPPNLKGVQPLPIDTTLLKDASDYKPIMTNFKNVPLYYDTRQIEMNLEGNYGKKINGGQNNQQPYAYQK